MRIYIALLIAVFGLLFFSNFSFAGSCPAGANTCFLCGGVNGIACDQNCPSGPNRPGLGVVACECPQGKACTCYCPYTGGIPVTGSGQVTPPVVPSQGSQVIPLTDSGQVAAPQGATLHLFEGEVEVRSPGGQWAQVNQALPLGTGYDIRTGPSGRAEIILDDGSKLFLDPDTELNMKELEPRSASSLDVVIELVKGALFSDVVNRHSTKWEETIGGDVIGVQGTQYSSYYDPATEEGTVKVLDGVVTVSDANGGSVPVNAGNMVSMTPSGISPSQAFDQKAESAKWSNSGAGTGSGCCGSAFVVLSVLALAFFRKSAA